MSHMDLERMHDLIDGAVPSAERAADLAHLAACPSCREEYGRLEAAVAAMRALPSEAHAPEGLWAGIAERIASEPAPADAPGGDGSGAEVLAFPGAHRTARRFALSAWQLAAAAVVVSLLSAGTVWMALAPGTARSSPMAAEPTVGEPGSAARMAASGEVAYEAAVLELQDLVDADRELMAPETREALDRSLRTIDEAMAEIRQALRNDPNSELLARLLANQQRSKLRVLRQAATAVQARS